MNTVLTLVTFIV